MNFVKIVKLTVRHYQTVYTANMDFFSYSSESANLKSCQYKIQPQRYLRKSPLAKISTYTIQLLDYHDVPNW